MIRASRQFTAAQREQVNEAVARAEAQTAAEIVPVVAGASGRYDRAEDVLGLWAGLVALALLFLLVPEQRESGAWGGISPATKLLMMLGGAVGGFVIGAVAASWWWSARRLFTPGRQMRDETQARARQVFYDASLYHTAGGTGVLIYISLYERRAVVLADRTVTEKLGQPALDDLCDALTKELASGDAARALIQIIEALGPKLAAALPRGADDTNELPDQLVTMD